MTIAVTDARATKTKDSYEVVASYECPHCGCSIIDTFHYESAEVFEHGVYCLDCECPECGTIYDLDIQIEQEDG